MWEYDYKDYTSEDRPPFDIFRYGYKCGSGKTICTWIDYWSTHTDDPDRHQIALLMERFRNIQPEKFYYITLHKKNGKYIVNLELTSKVRDKNKKASVSRSRWWYIRRMKKRQKQEMGDVKT